MTRALMLPSGRYRYPAFVSVNMYTLEVESNTGSRAAVRVQGKGERGGYRVKGSVGVGRAGGVVSA